MKESKNNLSPEMLGALSQAKQIYTQLSKNGVPVDAVNSETVKENQLLFEYLTAIHNAIVKKGIPAGGSQPSSTPSPSTSSNSPLSESKLKQTIRKAVLDSEGEREKYLIDNGGFSYAGLYERYLNVKKANGSLFSGFSSEYHTIINQYREIIEKKDAGELEKYNNDRTLSKSIDNMTQTLTPILESNNVTFRTLLRQRMAKWKKWPRWKNPYTYMYIFIGLLFSFVLTVSLVRNRQLQEENAIARSIINEYIIVDMAMSSNEDYQKERTQIHESIQENGFYVTWEEVCRLRAENP